ncbi:MAG: cold shock protein [Candidatus Phytoplasma asteris]|uniref:Cold shock protein n=2 Tax=16SrI (Aster yellows group) TaxID=3042590 RepID=Q6YPQ4_ONYPE|nr:cold shock domain-containing protein ['Chrysanthemum coronarium' phytoplasma]TKA88012.1 MAG: cold shock protein [Periwinkle leaf yellowing phytoplasma]WEX19509.1 MAG: cold shock protein [Candidatus Phytoplasma asteris]BAD04756.1 cold shock protein [Onion yellows phytoplasma OY-M]GAK74005.1 cold shock protein ['Chrysanthemum coronarium' phytoplasma]
MQDKKQQGTCRWFSKDKGYGFIVSVDGKDIFVHYSSIQTEVFGRKTLNENDKVEFTVKEGDRGAQAVDVVVVNE